MHCHCKSVHNHLRSQLRSHSVLTSLAFSSHPNVPVAKWQSNGSRYSPAAQQPRCNRRNLELHSLPLAVNTECTSFEQDGDLRGVDGLVHRYVDLRYQVLDRHHAYALIPFIDCIELRCIAWNLDCIAHFCCVVLCSVVLCCVVTVIVDWLLGIIIPVLPDYVETKFNVSTTLVGVLFGSVRPCVCM